MPCVGGAWSGFGEAKNALHLHGKHTLPCVSSPSPACLLQPGDMVGKKESWDPHEHSSIWQVK